MKKKLALIALLLSTVFSAFAYDGVYESVGFYSNLGQNPKFVGFSILVGYPVGIPNFNIENGLNAGGSFFDYTYLTNGGTKTVEDTKKGFFLSAVMNAVYTIDLDFFGIRLGVGGDFGFYNGNDDFKIGGMLGAIAGVEIWRTGIVSFICDIRPSFDWYNSKKTQFAAPLTISIRLNNQALMDAL